MKISLDWLNDFVDLSDLAPTKVADLLSLHTAEVEGLEEVGAALRSVVVGEVVECGPHPAADKLSVTRVAYGKGDPVPVVCGATNVRQGLKVAFAPVGAVLPGDFKIKKAKLRGEPSHGMICSARELELSDDHQGILELDPSAEVGQPLVDHLGIADTVIELDNKSLTHRPDLWGHYGFARELAAILGRPLQEIPVMQQWPAAQADAVSIQLEPGVACTYYAGLRIQLDGPPTASPERIARRLNAVGQRPINDLVDLSNYVMLEIGQPTHAFDWRRVRGGEIQVRLAADQEKLTTLDQVTRTLRPADMVIADGEGALALAGVMGGADSEVGDETTEILIESAVFDAVSVRRTAHFHALRSDASARFEKSLDPALADQALRRFALLLTEARPACQVLGPPSFAGSDQVELPQIHLHCVRAAELLGVSLQTEDMAHLLGALGFLTKRVEADLLVTVPSWRASKDVRTEIDLVEEIGRLHGYHRIQEQPLVAPVVAPPADPRRLLERRLVARLSQAHGGHESQGYTFIHRDWAQRLGLHRSDFVVVDNPVQDGVELIRHDPVPTLLDQAENNLRAESSGCLYEIGKGYRPNDQDLPTQRRWLAAVLWRPEGGPEQGPGSLLSQARCLVEDVFDLVGLTGLVATPGVDSAPWAHPVRSLGWQGELALAALLTPSLRQSLDCDRRQLAVVRIDLEDLEQRAAGVRPTFQIPSRFPGIKVDVALALPNEVPYAEVEASLRQAGGKFLADLRLFDLFSGHPLEEGWRSLAFHALLQAPDRTLQEKDEQKFLNRVAKAAERMGGSLRS